MGLAKVRLSKLQGIHKSHFYLHPKECKIWYNYRNENLNSIILKMLKKIPLSYLEYITLKDKTLSYDLP